MKRTADGASLGFFRLLFGSAMVMQMLSYLLNENIINRYLSTGFRFSYPYLEWVGPLPPPFTYAIFCMMLLAALGIALGYKYRLNIVLFFLGYSWILFIDQTEFLNHYYLIWLIAFLLMITNADRFLSIDQYRKKMVTEIPSWNIWIFQFQIAIVHIFAAIAKINTDWILRQEPIRMWFPGMPDIGIYSIIWGGIIFNALIIPLLLWKKTRLFAFGLVVIFHVVNSILFQIGIFPWLMICTTSVFLHPKWPRRYLSEKIMRGTTVSQAYVRPLLLLYCIIQIALPLRHYLYDGSSSWNERGRTFAWHMKLRDKQTILKITSIDVRTKKPFEINPQDHLSHHQIIRMQERPELIMMYGRFLLQEHNTIHIHSEASINGNPYKTMLDMQM
ncbi:HTTM domain-containing protein [Candidatus Peregrinibacteria bacterium]|jgi:vitamin K-dependent gamma-carboxylase|nr:HTTM domain-containing protein [Candidatus Peregrinibacteria bacterium]